MSNHDSANHHHHHSSLGAHLGRTVLLIKLLKDMIPVVLLPLPGLLLRTGTTKLVKLSEPRTTVLSEVGPVLSEVRTGRWSLEVQPEELLARPCVRGTDRNVTVKVSS